MRKGSGAFSLFLTVGVAGAAWTDESIDNREYRKYIPSGHVNGTGLMVFLHGVGGSKEDVIPSYSYDVQRWSDHFGFLAIVPDGSKNQGPGYKWNMDPNSKGEDDVAHILKILSTDADAVAVGSADGPKIALGFSNGAGMSSLLGCYDSTDLFVAHVAVHIDDTATFTEACGGGLLTGKRLRDRRLSTHTEKTWNAVGDQDFFLDGTGVEGLMKQFDNRCLTSNSTAVTCAASSGSCPGFSCYELLNCVDAGQLCVYEKLGHEMKSSMTATAWAYLTESAVPYNLTESPPPAPPGPSPPGPSPNCTAGPDEPCKKNGTPCCSDGLKCHRQKCV